MTARKIDTAKLRNLAIAGLPLKKMAEAFQIKRTDTVRIWLRREGLYSKWKERRRKEHACEHCGAPAAERFCSPRCWGLAHRRVIDPTVLAPYIERGVPLLRIAAEMNLDRGFLRAAMIRQGLYKNWTQRRYKKCAAIEVSHETSNLSR